MSTFADFTSGAKEKVFSVLGLVVCVFGECPATQDCVSWCIGCANSFFQLEMPI